ncbi:hypothetical protein FisN_8Lh065 [Fistulifera solaris]|uniref:Uncharacterized protein n=1 Tax=Fistulifera solaris TaxID=1519565 RepID=A0A1Z5JD90_FISSO|nr:hypothetical protein FisN_8Lh065 [Fistulifera solaris]|eukprot:GAX11973.1 hypothetical protein FisN_8Lh065 [Fistulifera solaris]
MKKNNPSARQRRTISVNDDDTRHNLPFCDYYSFLKERSIVFINDWDVEIREIEHFDRYSEFYSKLWYSKHDYTMFSAHDDLIVKIASAGNFYETAEHSIRGLEKQLNDENNNMEEMALEAVQKEQRRQREQGVYEPEALANIYRLASMSCKHEARIRGIQDALQVHQSPMLGFSVDGEHYSCDEIETTRRRKPRSQSMMHAPTAEVDHSSSHRSVRHSVHSHPISRSDRKSRYASLHERIIYTDVPKTRQPTQAPRRKARSLSLLGSVTANSYANEASSERALSPQKIASKCASKKSVKTNQGELLSSKCTFQKDAMTEDSKHSSTIREKFSRKSLNKRDGKKDPTIKFMPGSPRKRRSSLELNTKVKQEQ